MRARVLHTAGCGAVGSLATPVDGIPRIHAAVVDSSRTGTPDQTRLEPTPVTLAVTHQWRWEDKSPVLPSEPRVPLPESLQYVMSVMIELIWQTDGKLPWPILREATYLQADRPRLSRVSKNDFGAVTDKRLLKEDS